MQKKSFLIAVLMASCLSAFPVLADSTQGDPDSSLRVGEEPAPVAHHNHHLKDGVPASPDDGTGNDGTPHIGTSNGPPPGDTGGPLPGDRMGNDSMPPPGGGGVPRLSGGDDK